ncbi:MAG: hypothetical protein KUA43_02905 [Hoeflea sp.]|uniref:hypothetical protein n=1 Tax=Hoeflea sp. TaxID=1940281 RepID=UPI001DD1E202|nr:hypothetical protein [Hoeflea sp.]MBU4529879.1 hypothetical protein [Alphaproteobacteria bacterium]MBU4547100.1 hypothetical protein [Alphaproteobacteria bacterium]MBU4548713.1 hypothetical protein [Alphaproteobacteria bacterium]MBV1722372.1 hypothetical protein [Hoeflea sp.]MBV1762472.1 hypothetical protein [Hoeflea sp.]
MTKPLKDSFLSFFGGNPSVAVMPAKAGIQRDQVLDRERLFHGADAPWLDAGSSPA